MFIRNYQTSKVSKNSNFFKDSLFITFVVIVFIFEMCIDVLHWMLNSFKKGITSVSKITQDFKKFYSFKQE